MWQSRRKTENGGSAKTTRDIRDGYAAKGKSKDLPYRDLQSKSTDSLTLSGSDTNASDYIPPAAYQLCSSGPFGRIELFAALAEDLERAATDLDKKVIEFNAGSANVTREALMLFWKMQWNDRPGLDTLCKQDATERHYSDVRYSLFASERPQVQARFREILKVVGSRIWDDLELWDYSRGWSSMHTSLIKRARYISPGELEHWLQDFTAELTVEVISKIGIIRANQLNHADHCDWKTAWINEKMADRLWNVLGRLEEVLRLGAPAPVFQFGWKIGLRPEEICDRGRRMLTESIMETRKAM